eukprot:5675763-Prymnesium_polylepis.1
MCAFPFRLRAHPRPSSPAPEWRWRPPRGGEGGIVYVLSLAFQGPGDRRTLRDAPLRLATS